MLPKEFTVSPARQNALLAALAEAEWVRVKLKLRPILLARGRVIYEPGVRLKHVYFPATAIISILYLLADGASTEIAVVGNDGLVGASLLMADGATPSRAIVRNEGWAYRLEAEVLEKEFGPGSALHALLLRYMQALITQMAQTAVCNRHHNIDQQLCRWLLLSLDRIQSDKLKMTHDLVAHSLGVRREGVTQAACRLQSAGLIQYSRGCVTVVNRARLEARSCECYRVVKRESERLLPAVVSRL